MVLLSRKAKINRVKAALPGLLLDFHDNPPPRRQPFDEPSQLDRLGITKAWQDCRSATVPDLRGVFRLRLRQRADHRRRQRRQRF